jgi:tRNA A-37 threonylcarbamoyl transferase component Bud32
LEGICPRLTVLLLGVDPGKNVMDNPQAKKNSGDGASGPAGSRAPAQGESSGADFLPDDGATISDRDPSSTPPGMDASEPEVTFVDPSPSPGAGRPRSAIHAGRRQLRPGDLLGGRYEILQLLGEGGMGAVYKAWDREVEHLVALKLIRPEMADHPVILARFKQELLTARQVTHRNVIRIYDMAEADGAKYITMEFVEGSDLRKLLHEQGKLAPDRALAIVRQICQALEAAHGAGVIHRDLKPQNILQEKSGRILVMDFGLARSLESEGMTQSGVLLGTMEYMSPGAGALQTRGCSFGHFHAGTHFLRTAHRQSPV